MSPWTLAIGNIEIKPQAIEPQAWHVCTRCGHDKPESEYYQKFDSRRGVFKRRAQCKECMLEIQQTRREENTIDRGPASSKLILRALEDGAMTISQLCDETNMSRTAIRSMVPKLAERGLVKRSVRVGAVKTNSRIPMYELSGSNAPGKEWQ